MGPSRDRRGDRAGRAAPCAGHAPGPYQLQAAIAALHAEAPTAGRHRLAADRVALPSARPAGALAGRRAEPGRGGRRWPTGPPPGLTLVDALVATGALDDNHLLHATRADLLRRLDRRDEAAAAYRRALALAGTDVEREFLSTRLTEVTRSPFSS